MTIEKLRAGVVALVTMPSLITHDPIDTEAVALVDALIAAANADGFAEGVEFTTMELALDNCAELNNCAVALARSKAEWAGQEREVPPITNANNEKPETSANNPHEPKKEK